MVPKTDEIPQDEKSRLLTRGNKQDGNPNRNRGAAAKSRPQKRRNSDGSLDFERIVNGYSIQGELLTKMCANSCQTIEYVRLNHFVDSIFFIPYVNR